VPVTRVDPARAHPAAEKRDALPGERLRTVDRPERFHLTPGVTAGEEPRAGNDPG
jgi:hypothetical protein